MNNIAIRRVLSLLLVLAALGLAGCSGDKPKTGPGTSGTPGGKDMLLDLVELLRGAASNKQKPPARVADVAAFEGPSPAASAGLVNGEIVYVWGVGLGDDGTKALAWEKKTPKEGGWVLMQNGSLKEMAADEFKAAPKAK